jgi:hypothetical protein
MTMLRLQLKLREMVGLVALVVLSLAFVMSAGRIQSAENRMRELDEGVQRANALIDESGIEQQQFLRFYDQFTRLLVEREGLSESRIEEVAREASRRVRDIPPAAVGAKTPTSQPHHADQGVASHGANARVG